MGVSDNEELMYDQLSDKGSKAFPRILEDEKGKDLRRYFGSSTQREAKKEADKFFSSCIALDCASGNPKPSKNHLASESMLKFLSTPAVLTFAKTDSLRREQAPGHHVIPTLNGDAGIFRLFCSACDSAKFKVYEEDALNFQLNDQSKLKAVALKSVAGQYYEIILQRLATEIGYSLLTADDPTDHRIPEIKTLLVGFLTDREEALKVTLNRLLDPAYTPHFTVSYSCLSSEATAAIVHSCFPVTDGNKNVLYANLFPTKSGRVLFAFHEDGYDPAIILPSGRDLTGVLLGISLSHAPRAVFVSEFCRKKVEKSKSLDKWLNPATVNRIRDKVDTEQFIRITKFPVSQWPRVIAGAPKSKKRSKRKRK